jgi:hypothetical protein
MSEKALDIEGKCLNLLRPHDGGLQLDVIASLYARTLAAASNDRVRAAMVAEIAARVSDLGMGRPL